MSNRTATPELVEVLPCPCGAQIRVLVYQVYAMTYLMDLLYYTIRLRCYGVVTDTQNHLCFNKPCATPGSLQHHSTSHDRPKTRTTNQESKNTILQISPNLPTHTSRLKIVSPLREILARAILHSEACQYI